MSDLNKNEIIAELKELRGNLTKLSDAEKDVHNYKSKVNDLENKTVDNLHLNLKPTTQYKDTREKYKSNKERNRGYTLRFILILIGLSFILVCFGAYALCGLFIEDDDWSAPEMLREYTGVYYTSADTQMDMKITFTSCSKKGELEGTVEFNDNGKHGKYTINGIITKRTAGGYTVATLKLGEWIERPTGYYINDMEIQIYDNYRAIRGYSDNMRLYASDHKQPAAVTDLNTPEIIGTYSGKFEPNTYLDLGVADARFIIDSCDDEGNVTGVFEYTFKDGSAKREFTGKITSKYDDGTVKLNIVRGKDISGGNFNSYIPNNEISIEIYDNYRSFICSENMHWAYADGEYEEMPEKTRLESVQTTAVIVVILVYLVLTPITIILIVRNNIDISFYSPKQKRKLRELQAQDKKNVAINNEIIKNAKAQIEKDKLQLLPTYKKELKNAERRAEEYGQICSNATILNDEDKTLYNVNFLINALQSGRADTLKEALHLLDAHNTARNQQLWNQTFAEINAKNISNAMANMQIEQISHNFRAQQELKKQTKELEEINRKLNE